LPIAERREDGASGENRACSAVHADISRSPFAEMQFHPVDDAPLMRFYATAMPAPMWKRRLLSPVLFKLSKK
jgi:hypothetical protein